jgi:hypothetical protein
LLPFSHFDFGEEEMAKKQHCPPLEMRSAKLVAIGLTALCASCGAASESPAPENRTAAIADPPILQPQPLTINPPLDNAKERNNLSGAACNGRGVCLLIGDEKRYARFFTLQGNSLVPAQRVFLLPTNEGGTEMDESDGEGIAFSNGSFYVVGSHSRTKTGDAQASRHFLFRLPGDQPSPPSADIGTETAVSGVQRTSLDPIINGHLLLSQHLAEPPGDSRDGNSPSHGVNIEGIAVAGDDLFVGFRGPVDGDGAVILKVGASSLFGGSSRPVETCRVPLGEGQGVRDLAAVQGGLLILSGPERRNNVAPNPEFFLWRPGSAPIRLGRLARTAGDDNPESITVLEETAEGYRVLVLWDGDAGGLPMVVQVPKPRDDQASRTSARRSACA